MDKEWIRKVSQILEERLRVCFDYPVGYTPDVVPETWIEGETAAAYAITREHEQEIAKLKRDEQLAILSCGHHAAWADDDGCKGCEYEEQIAELTNIVHAMQMAKALRQYVEKVTDLLDGAWGRALLNTANTIDSRLEEIMDDEMKAFPEYFLRDVRTWI